MTDSRIDLKSLTQAELSELLTDRGFPKYRAKQVMDWLQKGAVSADEMTNLPAALRNRLANECMLETPRPSSFIMKSVRASASPGMISSSTILLLRPYITASLTLIDM